MSDEMLSWLSCSVQTCVCGCSSNTQGKLLYLLVDIIGYMLSTPSSHCPCIRWYLNSTDALGAMQENLEWGRSESNEEGKAGSQICWTVSSGARARCQTWASSREVKKMERGKA